jgi:prepilin-type N-terminal cleavage/methylation domain-containing protein
MKRAHLSNGAPAEGTPALFIARAGQREVKLRGEQEAFPSATWERGNRGRSIPGTEVPGYFQSSRWDEGRRRRTAHTCGGDGYRGRAGFTLLEMVIVLIIIALLFTVSMPAMQSAFVEQGLRSDSHQLAMMVKTAMIQCAEQHRNYTIELDSSTMALHPEGAVVKETDDSIAPGSASVVIPAMVDVTDSATLDAPNKLLAPDAVKVDAWVDMPPTTWTFRPGELCPATHIRMSRGDAWVEMNFSALTGNVENETSYFP